MAYGPPTDDDGKPLGAPPNSEWDATTGQWKTKKPGEAGYDKSWGGYADTHPEFVPSVAAAQGWPKADPDPPPTEPAPTPPYQPPAPVVTSNGVVGASNSNQSPAQQWNSQPTPDPMAQWYQPLIAQILSERQAEKDASKQRSDALYTTLNGRANQGLNINADDPGIKGQVDTYRATSERARRNYLSDIAESRGPLANIRGEERMSAEKLGQSAAGFQAELVARERGRIADEVGQALAMQGNLLQGDQSRDLTSQLALLDQAVKEGSLGLQGRGQNLQAALGFGGLDLQRELGIGGLGLQQRGQDMSMDQFLRELALREWQLGDESDWRWAMGA